MDTDNSSKIDCNIEFSKARETSSDKPGHIFMRFNYLAIIPLLLLAACSSRNMPVKPPVDTGFTVDVTQSFDALPNYSRVFFQGGMRIADGGLDKWTTFCQLRIYNPDRNADYLTAVVPGSFAVARVRYLAQSSDYSYPWPGTYSARGAGSSRIGVFYGGRRSRHDGPPAYYLYGIEMTLQSAEQPDVRTLICSKKWATRGNHYPTLAEIRQALGTQIKLTPSTIAIAGDEGNDAI